MKLSNVSKLLVLGLIVSISALGCKSKTPTTVTQIPAGKTGGTGSGSSSTNDIGNTSPVAAEDKPIADKNGLIPQADHSSTAGWIANDGIFKNYTVHFAYDSSVIQASEKPNLEAVATQLKAASSPVALRVEGHCDERGTEEYNRALGERRALALREELIRLGVEQDRIETISYGNDKPLVIGHDETSYKQNRRGEFVQLTPPQ